MNPIEKDLRSYFGITSESNILEHYGTKRHSGRYPWGSGDTPYQHSGDFLFSGVLDQNFIVLVDTELHPNIFRVVSVLQTEQSGINIELLHVCRNSSGF